MKKDNLKELLLEFGDNVKFDYDLKTGLILVENQKFF